MTTANTTTKRRRKEFRVSERIAMLSIHPVDTFTGAKLFWGVPKWAKCVYQDPTTGDWVFTDR